MSLFRFLHKCFFYWTRWMCHLSILQSSNGNTTQVVLFGNYWFSKRTSGSHLTKNALIYKCVKGRGANSDYNKTAHQREGRSWSWKGPLHVLVEAPSLDLLWAWSCFFQDWTIQWLSDGPSFLTSSFHIFVTPDFLGSSLWIFSSSIMIAQPFQNDPDAAIL